MRTLFAASSLALFFVGSLGGCPADDDDTVDSDCPVQDRFTSLPATGASAESFRLLGDGDTLPVVFGAQGGYHIDLAVRMQNLCPVVFVDFELFDVTGGARTLIHSSRRHVQAVREEDTDPPSLQRWWVEQFGFPCAYWPNDPVNDPFCDDPPIAFIDELDLVLRIASEDHNTVEGGATQDRGSAAEVSVTATCCDG